MKIAFREECDVIHHHSMAEILKLCLNIFSVTCNVKKV